MEDNNYEVMTDESVENEEVADLQEEVTDDSSEYESEETQEVAEPEKEEQDYETRATFANIRRQAEAEAQRKMDMQIARLCNGVTHPVTGKPISTFKEYEDAIQSQARIQAEQTLEDNGIDVSLFDDYINNSPVLREAQAIIEQNKIAQSEAQVKADFEAVQMLDSSIKTYADLANLPTWGAILGRVNSGMSLVDAYKLENYNDLMNKRAQAGKQAAINQARGKAHLESSDSISATDGNIDIPDSALNMVKEAFPDKSLKELKKLYNQVYKKK